MYKLEEFNVERHSDAILRMKLREEDRREFETTSGETGNHPVLNSAIMSEECVVITLGGTVIALWGVVPFKEFAVVWGCGTDGCLQVIHRLTEDVKPFLNRWEAKFGSIGGVIDSRNTKHIKWLERLGFNIIQNTSFVRDVPFHFFFRRSNV